MRRPALLFSVVMAVAGCCGLVTGAGPAGASSAAGAWRAAQEVPGLAALNSGGTASVSSVSCGSAGDCAAGGYYTDSSGNTQAFLADESGGSWGTAQEVPGLAALNADGVAEIVSVSCDSAGDCAAGGYYTSSSGLRQAFVVDESAGRWGAAQQVPGLAAFDADGDAEVTSVSCAPAGDCAAGGSYRDGSGHYQGFVADEVGGSWGTAQPVPGLAALNAGGVASVNFVSCASPGDCAAGGSYTVYPASASYAGFVVDESGGRWGTAQSVPVSAPGLSSLSCGAAGDCAAVGYSGEGYDAGRAFVVDEAGGSWGTAEPVPGLATLGGGHGAGFGSVSCASAGNCAAGGYYYTSPTGSYQPFVIDKANGSWGTAEPVPGVAALNADGDAGVGWVSCAPSGDCVATGGYTDSSGSQQAFVVDEAGGSWGTAEPVPGLAALNAGGDAWVSSVSCAPSGSCAAGGSYTVSSGHQQGFVVDQAGPTSTAVSLSAPTVSYGDEQTEQVSVAVTSSSGTPDGTVTVNAGTVTLCTFTLASGSGSCTLPSTGFPPGTVNLTASYSGSDNFLPSVAPARTLTVSKAATRTRLRLSRKTVVYGKERREHLTMSVTAPYGGTPDGKVAIKARKGHGRTKTICTVTLRSGNGKCVLAARRLRPGTYRLIAHYLGAPDFARSTAAAKLRVVR